MVLNPSDGARFARHPPSFTQALCGVVRCSHRSGSGRMLRMARKSKSRTIRRRLARRSRDVACVDEGEHVPQRVAQRTPCGSDILRVR